MQTQIRKSKSICGITLAIAGLILILLVFFPWPKQGLGTGYGHFHTAIEFLGIASCFAIFTVGLTTYRHSHSQNILLISVASIAVGILDLGHTMAHGLDFNQAMYFWVVARLTYSVAFLVVAISFAYKIDRRVFSRLAWAVAVIWAFFWCVIIATTAEVLPELYHPATGPTGLKYGLELLFVVLSVAAGVVFYQQSKRHDTLSFIWLSTASFLFGMSSILFMLNHEVNLFYSIMAHVYKVLAFFYAYRAILGECITAPYLSAKKNAFEAEQTSEYKTRFLANIGHELRTPLGVITGFSDILQMSRKLDEEGSDWVRTIKSSAEQIRLLINDLLDLSKAESNSLTIHLERIILRETLDEVLSGLTLLASKKGLKLSLREDSLAPTGLQTDSLRFKQILVNLLSNAIKFTDQGSVEIMVSAVEDGQVFISIKDTGVGIAENKRHLLFKSYSQIEHNNVRAKEGTGLGLALSKKLASLLGGELFLERSEEGVGSVFTLRLPAELDFRMDKILTREKMPSEQIVPRFGGVHVLVVDDSSENLFIAEQFLGPTGAIITLIENPLEAIEFVRKHRESVDVIFMDIKMPQMDGREATHKIRTEGFKGPVIALSAHSDLKESGSAVAQEFNGHIMKPMSKEILWEKVAGAVLA